MKERKERCRRGAVGRTGRPRPRPRILTARALEVLGDKEPYVGFELEYEGIRWAISGVEKCTGRRVRRFRCTWKWVLPELGDQLQLPFAEAAGL